ncbi:MAG: aspartate-semialdehyde dehydrogenase [Alphaproteobacteria bacterium]|nr:aspartate-semialdehyde dehydrogenase [Alphaproteobacteria bacterium]
MKKMYNVAVVGATGNAGNNTIRILEERRFPIENLYAVASEKSVGAVISFNNRNIQVLDLSKMDFSNIDIAFFCAGSAVSKRYAKHATELGCTIIDKTSCFRLEPKVPLVVPEINGHYLKSGAALGIISTPNCIAGPLSMALKAVSQVAKLKRVVISTYQSVSGAGKSAIDELYRQTKSVISSGTIVTDVFSKQIAFNAIPAIGDIYSNGISDEEDKIASEIRKILHSDVKVAVTCVRVPVFVGHGISVACEVNGEFSVNQIYDAFNNFPGILSVDRKGEEVAFATPLDAQGEDAVFISRIRKDISVKNGVLFWVVADNLRKGAALNSVQIAENMIKFDSSLSIFKRSK